MNNKEKKTLLYFLKENYSTRALDELLDYNPKKSKGWNSFNIQKKFHLFTEDKGKLFLYKKRHALRIIKKIEEINKPGSIDILIAADPPTIIQKYKNSYLLAESDKSLAEILSGESRNIIYEIFKDKRGLVESCQINKCNNLVLQTCHYSKSRPTLLMNSANKNKVDLNGLFMYKLYNVFNDFLVYHKTAKAVAFLCQKHHLQLDGLEKNGPILSYRSFKSRINWK